MKGVVGRWLTSLGLQFHDEAIEAEFVEWSTGRLLRNAAWMLLVAALGFSSVVWIDRYLNPEAAEQLTLIRLCSGGGMLVGAALLFIDSPVVRRHWQPLAMLVAAACGTGIALVALTVPPYGVNTMAGVVVCAFGCCTLFGLRVPWAFVGAGMILLPYTAVITMIEPALFERRVMWLLWLVICWFFGMLAAFMLERSRRLSFTEQRKSDRLLHNVLPSLIADRLRERQIRIAEEYEEVTVLFADLVGFTQLTRRLRPSQLVDLLDRLFLEFDRAAADRGLEKIKTIGDAYMAAAGVPLHQADHARAAVALGIDMLEIVREFDGVNLGLRIGIHTGPAVAGVIGEKRLQYDLWGDTVNTASRLETHGVTGAIQVSRTVRELLDGQYAFEDRGVIELRGVGPCEAFLIRPQSEA